MESYFDKVKDFVYDLEFTIEHEDKAEEMLVISNEEVGISNLILDIEEPILIFEQFIFELKDKSPEVLESLLKKNREIIHGAFVLDDTGSKVIFRDTLQLENLDMNEFEGTINSLSILMSEYSGQLLSFAK
jgi:hypothetical protein